MINSRIRAFVIALSILILCAAGFVNTLIAQNKPENFLVSVKKIPAKLRALPARSFDLQSRVVKLNLSLLNSLGEKTGAQLNFNLFNDAAFVGVVDNFEKPYADSKAWLGHLTGTDGTFTLVNHRGTVLANIRSAGQGSYQIRSAGGRGGFYTVRKIDESKFKDCGLGRDSDVDYRITAAETLQERPSASRVLADNGSEITVLVVYTPAARDRAASQAGNPAGTKTDIEALVDTCIAETNQQYAVSGINPRLRLIYRNLQVYQGDAGNGESVYTTLPLFRGKADGKMDDVHTIRTNQKADVAILIMVASDAGGLARMMNNNTFNSAFESQAFAVVDMDSASGNYAFGHEIGHIQGNCHDRGNCRLNDGTLDQGVFPYSYGYRYTTGGTLYHTVMAYRPGALSLHFSNPAINDNGVPTGIPEGQPNPSNEAKTINNTASIVANFRVSNP